jgi:6-phosphofructo-2-kinase/fructose-2,6-biphosphatase 2
MYNVEGKIGGDAELSPRGQMYAKALPSLIVDAVGDQPLNVSLLHPLCILLSSSWADLPSVFALQVWTSTMRRTIQTAQHLPYPKKTWKSLDELDGGVCDGMTYEEIEVNSAPR